MRIRLLIADDHRLMREALVSVLEREEGLEVIGQAEDGRACLSLAEKHCPDVVVMDIGMPGLGGVEATRQLAAVCPDARVVALSTYSDSAHVLEMLSAGARGYVTKRQSYDELLEAVRAVSQGRSYLSTEVAGVVVDAYRDRSTQNGSLASLKLGPREREVLQLVAEGKTSKEIGGTLHISPKTVEAHRRHIAEKLGLRTVAELTKYAIRAGLTSLDG